MARKINGLRVFSATKALDRDRLGEQVTEWIRMHPDYEIEDIVTKLSSDDQFHCLAIVITFFDPETKAKR